MNLQVELAAGSKIGLAFKNPVLVASGFAGYGNELAPFGDVGLLGGMVTNPISLRPWKGSSQPRLRELAAGVMVHTGNQNPGWRRVTQQYSQTWAGIDTPWIARLCGATVEEYAELAGRLEGVEGIAGLEVAFPWSAAGGWDVAFGLDIINAVQAATWLPLLVVLPFVEGELPWHCVQAGADALVVADAPLGVVWRDGQMWAGQVYGPTSHPVVAQQLAQVASWVDCPLIGRGAVHTLEDVLNLLIAGAVAVQIDSAIWRDSSVPWRLLHELERWMDERGLSSLEALRAFGRGPTRDHDPESA